MVSRDFVEKIEEMAKCETLEFAGVKHTTKKTYAVMPPIPDSIKGHTLKAIKTYCDSLGGEAKSLFIHIFAPGKIIVASKLAEATRAREFYLNIELINDCFAFDRFMDVEQFIISLQSQFVQDDNTAKILAVVGNITENGERRTMDDGTSQSVTTRQGLARVGETMVPNPVTLRPYRTFAEIEQPESRFVLRLKGGKEGKMPAVALFEADGGAWKLEAIANIEKWLAGNINESIPIIA